MFRKEFADVITKTGMVPLKDLRQFILDKDHSTISEFGLLELDYFDDTKFAKQVSAKYGLTFIDLYNAKIPQQTIGLIRKSDVLKFRSLPIQKKAGTVTVAAYDPKRNYKHFSRRMWKLFLRI